MRIPKLLVLTMSLCASGAIGAALAAAPAAAAGLSPPVADCYAHGQLTRSYSVMQLQKALATMPVDIAEYTNCHDAIQRALLAKLGKLRGSDAAGGGGSFLPAPLLVVLGLLVLGGAGFGLVAVRNRRGP